MNDNKMIETFEYMLGRHTDNTGITSYPNLQEARDALEYAINRIKSDKENQE